MGLEASKKEKSAIKPSSVYEEGYIKLTDWDPEELGKNLFEEKVPNVSKIQISAIIGKGGEYHNLVLKSYINCFHFEKMLLDEAFRFMCEHFQLAGETQMVDRILYQFSRRYWDCNPLAHKTFKNIGLLISKFRYCVWNLVFTCFIKYGSSQFQYWNE